MELESRIVSAFAAKGGPALLGADHAVGGSVEGGSDSGRIRKRFV